MTNAIEVFRVEPTAVSFPVQLTPPEEVKNIVGEYRFGEMLSESALFRVWRMWRSNDYMLILSDDPEAKTGQTLFSGWSDFMNTLKTVAGLKKSRIYSRLKSYSLLEFLEYTTEEMYMMMSARPSLYERVLSAIFIWDKELGEPIGLRTDVFGEMDDPLFKPRVRSFLKDLDVYDDIEQALDHLKHDIMGKAKIMLYASDSKIVLDYEGGGANDEYGVVEFHSEDPIPDWVLEELHTKYKFAVNR